MRHSRHIAPQFFVTAPQPCPYLQGRVERKLFTALSGNDAEILNDTLSHQGFRRSQNVLYRPACAECAACMSVRIKVQDFKFTRSQRRILNRNSNLTRHANAPWATEDQYDLFSRYLAARHGDGGMADMDIFEFAAMVEETPIRTRVLEFHDEDNTLTAACLTDVINDGLSLVYSFFRPDLPKQSLGRYVILDHIRLAQETGLAYVYLGYWVPGSPTMDYKAEFDNLEVYVKGQWRPFTADMKHAASDDPLSIPPIAEQVNDLTLPKATFE